MTIDNNLNAMLSSQLQLSDMASKIADISNVIVHDNIYFFR